MNNYVKLDVPSSLEVKCGPLYKDQGVGAVVNIILYLSLGYHMVLKVVRLKKERVVVSLAAVSVSSIA